MKANLRSGKRTGELGHMCLDSSIWPFGFWAQKLGWGPENRDSSVYSTEFGGNVRSGALKQKKDNSIWFSH